MKLTFNNEIVGGLNGAGIIDFNLFDIAKALGYAQPKRAIQQFTESTEYLQIFGLPTQVDYEKADESIVYAFLFYSRMPRAIDFRKWVFTEVLPLVRQVGMQALKENAIRKQLRQDFNTDISSLLRIADLPTVNKVLAEDGNYRQLGFYPPSHFGNPIKIALALNEYGVFDSEGSPLPEYSESVWYSDRWQGHHNGKWYAYKPELVEKVLAQVKIEPSKPVWFENIFINDLELR